VGTQKEGEIGIQSLPSEPDIWNLSQCGCGEATRAMAAACS
jgi:hypothetical protein